MEKEEEEKFARLTGRDPKSAKGRWGKVKAAQKAGGALARIQKEAAAKRSKNEARAQAARRKLEQLREQTEVDHRRELARERFERSEKRRLKKLQKKADLPPVAIPWALLDALDGAKKSFENEKAFMDYNHKI